MVLVFFTIFEQVNIIVIIRGLYKKKEQYNTKYTLSYGTSFSLVF